MKILPPLGCCEVIDRICNKHSTDSSLLSPALFIRPYLIKNKFLVKAWQNEVNNIVEVLIKENKSVHK